MLYNEEVEQCFLGCLLMDDNLYDDVSFINQAYFYNALHGRIFDLIKKIKEENRIVTVNQIESYLSSDKELPEGYIRDLLDCVISTRAISGYADLIYNLHIRRAIDHLGDNLSELSKTEDAELTTKQIIAQAEKFIFSSTEENSKDNIKHISHNINEAIEEINNPTMGILSGIDCLDKSIRGFKGGCLYIIAGRPGMGKTAYGLTLAVNTAIKGHNALFFSLEMPHNQLIQRIVKRIPNVERISKLPFCVDDSSGLTISDICSKARRHKRKNGLDILFIDYLGLITSEDKRLNKVHQIEEITTRMKGLAKELGIPVVLFSQLSRAVEQRENKRPMLSDLRDSGSIEQDADVVMLLYREYYYYTQNEANSKNIYSSKKEPEKTYMQIEAMKEEAEIIIAKNRHGITEKLMVKFHADMQYFGDK